MEHSDSGAVSRRPHHISSIAHLFLGEGRTAEADASVPEVRRCAVAAPGGAAISAFAAAGLALGSPGPATLSEGDLVRWSAGSYLGSDAGITRRAAAGGGRGQTWTVRSLPDPSLPGGAGGSNGPDYGPAIHWNHLGCLGLAELAHLESLAAARTRESGPPACPDCLVWCLEEDEAGRLGTSYFLGRLAEVLRPGRIELLLFPDAWSSAGRPGWLDEIRNVGSLRYDNDNLAPVVKLAKQACGGIPLGVHQVTGADNLAANFVGARNPDSLWRRVALRVASGRTGC